MVYDKIVKNSKEILIIVEWIKLLYSILSYNPVIKKSDLKKLLDKEQESQVQQQFQQISIDKMWKLLEKQKIITLHD